MIHQYQLLHTVKETKNLAAKMVFYKEKMPIDRILKIMTLLSKDQNPGLLIRFDLTKLVEPFSKLFTMFQRSELRSFLFQRLQNKQTATKTFTCNRMSEASEKL